jgi:YfiH family protein
VIRADWPAPAGIHALTTTRTGGVSREPFAEFNLADHVGDDPAAVQHNRRLLGERLALPAPPVWLRQVHGAGVVDAARPGNSPEADASFSREPGVLCAVLTADCLPVLLCDRHAHVVAAAHAGWRGLAAGVLEQTVLAMQADPAGILAWLGPAIGAQAFAVGAEVRQVFVERHPAAATAFSAGPGDRWLADIYRLARIRLQSVGVCAVYGGGLCTWSDRQRFYSYRREPVTGRMASLIWMSE